LAVGVSGVFSNAERPGAPEVYEQIEGSTDCDDLQSTFDRAYRNHSLAADRYDEAEMKWTGGYMDAADQRMRDIGCYG
jgi:hypothetical protein